MGMPTCVCIHVYVFMPSSFSSLYVTPHPSRHSRCPCLVSHMPICVLAGIHRALHVLEGDFPCLSAYHGLCLSMSLYVCTKVFSSLETLCFGLCLPTLYDFSIYMVIRVLVTVAINTSPACPQMCHGTAMGLRLSKMSSVSMSLHATECGLMPTDLLLPTFFCGSLTGQVAVPYFVTY